jgi:hypothetical protein
MDLTVATSVRRLAVTLAAAAIDRELGTARHGADA